MGVMIGMPCMKLNNAGKSSAKCGSFGAVAAEALEERQGKDPDIDHERTTENLYTGFRTAAELQEYSRQHVSELSEKQRAEGKRGIRGDAVVMCATIIKPPAAFMETLSREDQIRFLKDAEEKLDELIGGRQNSKASVIHFDEQGAHLHKFWEPMTDDGRLCAKDKMNLKFFNRLNREMPQHMRSRGWDINDCKAYDENAEKELAAEQEKSAQRKKAGKTSVQFKAEAERQKNELCEEIDALEVRKAEAKAAAEQAETEARQKASEASRKAEEYRQTLQAAEDRLEAVREPVAAVGTIEAIAGRYETPFLSKKRLRTPEDDEKLIAAARHGAAVDRVLKDKDHALRDLQRRYDIKSAALEQQTKRATELEKENRELRTFKDRAMDFLSRHSLLKPFQELIAKLDRERSQKQAEKQREPDWRSR